MCHLCREPPGSQNRGRDVNEGVMNLPLRASSLLYFCLFIKSQKSSLMLPIPTKKTQTHMHIYSAIAFLINS